MRKLSWGQGWKRITRWWPLPQWHAPSPLQPSLAWGGLVASHASPCLRVRCNQLQTCN